MVGDDVVFRVDGVPVQQGSKSIAKGGGKVWLRDANAARLKPWRALVAEAADLGVTFESPVSVSLGFDMPRPRKPKFQRPGVRPDVDKLTRAVLDGLTDGGLLADDSLVVELHVYEHYSESPGVTVTVREVE